MNKISRETAGDKKRKKQREGIGRWKTGRINTNRPLYVKHEAGSWF